MSKTKTKQYMFDIDHSRTWARTERGCPKKLKEQERVILVECPTCKGTGSESWDTDRDCRDCAGRGFQPTVAK